MLKLRWPSWGLVRKALVALATAVGIGTLYIWHLGKLTAGLSPAEALARASSRHIHAIWVNPVNAPQRLIQYGIQAAGHHGAFWVRLPSVLLAVVFLYLFYLMAKMWFGRTVGLLSTLMLAATPWAILLARSATADILLLAPIALWLSYDHLRRAKGQHLDWAWLLLLAVIAICLYVPGLIWLVLVGTLINWRTLRHILKNISRAYLIGGLVLGLVLLAPLLLAIFNEPGIAKTLVLWPAHWLAPLALLKALAWSVLAIFWRMPYHIPMNLARLPILDITQIILGIFGIYAMWAKARQEFYVLVGLAALGIVGSAVDHNLLLLTLTLPTLAILGAAGLRYLYVEWRNVFPNNPIPRTLAIVLMAGIVGLHMVLGIRYALIAWPHSPATKAVYVIK